MIKILVAEDDRNIAKLIEAAVSIGGYQVECASDGDEALQKINSSLYDLILLDVMMPNKDGFEVLTAIKDRDIPVIFLTAMGDVGHKVMGLRLGAEDYIVKPFEAIELLARIEVVLRRRHKTKSILTYDEITVDTDAHTVTKDGEIITLTPKEFEVLVFFIQNVDSAISRERLLSSVWGYEFRGESRTVDIHVQQLRRKTGLAGRLVTIPKLGYRLESR